VTVGARAADDAAHAAEKARALLDRGDALAASPFLEDAVTRNPKSAELHYLLARSYTIEAKQSSNAVRLAYIGWNVGVELETALALDPTRNDARLDLIRYYELTPRVLGGSPARAREQATELAGRDAARGAFAAGYIAYREKEYGSARLSLRAAVAQAKDDETRILALTWLGWLSQETQQYDEAFTAFERILAIDPKHAPALYETGRTAVFSRRELERGEESLRRYLLTKPRFDEPSLAAAHLQLGLLLEVNGEREEARSEVRTALHLDSKVEGGRTALRRLR
jgi:tetratricopeptide (TPR) repeat protein